MCGICGVVSVAGEIAPEIRAAVPRMSRAVRHRGPDGEGFYHSPDHKAVFGHRRLSIIDRAGGAQPMCNEDRTVWVVFNGEIYNHRSLRVLLESKGHVFRSSSDTEAIIHGYEEFGDAVVDKLHGMFAFALYNERSGQLLLARDRVGKKPLFYGVLDGVLHFGSELKSLRQSPAWSETVDNDALESYLSLGYVIAPRTIYRGVHKLMPAHTLSLRAGTITTRRYWDVREFDSDRRGEQDIVEDVSASLRDAVRERLESEVPLGAFLSGGIDSGLVVSYMAEALPAVITTSVGFEDRAHNELELAAVTAERWRTTHCPECVEPDLTSVLDTVAASFDEPFADSSAIPTQYVSSLARKHVSVALSGDGGDEVFGGYGFRYIPHIWEDRVRRLVKPFGAGHVFVALGARWPIGANVPRWLRWATYLRNVGGTAVEAYYADMRVLDASSTAALLGLPGDMDYRTREPYQLVSDAYTRCESNDPLQKAQYADLHTYMPNDPLVKVDRMSMLHSLEVRSPLLDHRLIEMAFRVPRATKFKNMQPKYLLRELAGRRLPPELLTVPKRGFTAPVARWIMDNADTLRAEVCGTNSTITHLVDARLASAWLADHLSGVRDRSTALWTLWMLQKWSVNCSRSLSGLNNAGPDFIRIKSDVMAGSIQ